MSRDELRIFSWVAASVFVFVAGVWRPRSLHWTAFGSVLLFAALNAGAGIYVLNHFGDSRWSAGGAPPLSAPSFSGTPVVGQFLGPLDSALNVYLVAHFKYRAIFSPETPDRIGNVSVVVQNNNRDVAWIRYNSTG